MARFLSRCAAIERRRRANQNPAINQPARLRGQLVTEWPMKTSVVDVAALICLCVFLHCAVSVPLPSCQPGFIFGVAAVGRPSRRIGGAAGLIKNDY